MGKVEENLGCTQFHSISLFTSEVLCSSIFGTSPDLGAVEIPIPIFIKIGECLPNGSRPMLVSSKAKTNFSSGEFFLIN